MRDAYRRAGADGLFGDPRRDHEAGMEGYYWRFTDAVRGRVVIALCGVCSSPTGRWAIAALATHPGGEVRTAVAEVASGEHSGLALNAAPVASATEREVRFAVDGGALHVEIRAEKRWQRRALGGSGLAHLAPGLPQYWHPHLLGGRASGAAEFDGRRVELDGTSVYAEKNWGPGFPEQWWWGQADAFANHDACVAFAGGPVGLAGVPLAPTAVAVRIGEQLLALAPPAATVKTTLTAARWEVRARSLRHDIRIEGEQTANGAVILPVPVPGRREVLPRSRQVLAGRMGVVVRRGARTLFEGESDLAGLEQAHCD